MPIDRARTAAIHERPGPHVVLTGVGYGEFVMLKRVIDGLLAARPDAKISVALRDNAAIAHVRARYPELNVSWWPEDRFFGILHWLGSQRPDLLVLIEGHRQPLLIAGASRYGARVALLNGRLRDRASFHHPIFRHRHRWYFRGYSALALQAAPSVEAIRDLVDPTCDLVVSGDIKTDFRASVLSAEREAELWAWLESDVPLVAAGSTDNLEEERMVLAAFRKVRAEVPCRLLLAPRHPGDLPGLPEAIEECGLSFARRSAGDHPPVDVLLLDTQGELANAYGRCVAAYVGGSFSPGGTGHNPIEPLAAGVPVAYGRERSHFAAIQAMIEETGVGTRIAGEDDLAAFWLRFLHDSGERARVGEAAARLLEAHRGAVDRSVAMLVRLLPPREERDR